MWVLLGAVAVTEAQHPHPHPHPHPHSPSTPHVLGRFPPSPPLPRPSGHIYNNGGVLSSCVVDVA
ncbi:hypothetical protein E2C01_097538 [Portunus trituberculatus]|uniref:Uncharacterized protein n=1 Tax=Portunus trituberculatus TaxID=210409 RepID=A0A5B7KBN5_PORTR|nr:hypothetical protein [Portunus trituberculatus]